MAVSENDVRQVAELARLTIDPGRMASLVRELNGILAHMEELGAVDPAKVSESLEIGVADLGSAPLRDDVVAQLPLSRQREDFAPEMRDGFFLVPRLATHEGAGERTP